MVRAVVLDGSLRSGDSTAIAAGAALRALRDRGAEAELIVPRTLSVAPCSGCFRCWFKTPGICVTDDDARSATAAVVAADLVVLVSPVTYGGYSSPIKAILDRSIGIVSPLFTTIRGETRHRPRYERYPSLVAIGVQSEGDPAEAAVFRSLAARNAMNLHAPAVVSAVIVAGRERHGAETLPEELVGRLRRSVEEALEPTAAHRPGAGAAAVYADGPPAAAPPHAESLLPPRDALLLMGSPRRGRSTSGSLGAYLGARLAEAGVLVDTVVVRETLAEAGGGRRLLQAYRDADLVVVLSPLYVDSLPAPLTRALELLGGVREAAVDRPGGPCAAGAATGAEARPRRLAAVVNSGFPEAGQSDTALAICATFARRCGVRWAGGLALGAGAALDGRPLEEAGEMVEHCRRAVELTATSLAAGRPVPAAAVALMARPLVPAPLYRERCDRGFRGLAQKHGVADHLGDRPYARDRHAGGR